jgi:hypothetical protein
MSAFSPKSTFSYQSDSFVWGSCPNTKGRTFNELDTLFAKQVFARKLAATDVDASTRRKTTSWPRVRPSPARHILCTSEVVLVCVLTVAGNRYLLKTHQACSREVTGEGGIAHKSISMLLFPTMCRSRKSPFQKDRSF